MTRLTNGEQRSLEAVKVQVEQLGLNAHSYIHRSLTAGETWKARALRAEGILKALANTPKPRPDDDDEDEDDDDLRARHRRLKGAIRRAFQARDVPAARKILEKAMRKDRQKPGPKPRRVA